MDRTDCHRALTTLLQRELDHTSRFLVCLGDTTSGQGFGERVGINQVVFDVASQTVAMQSDELLRQHARYLLVVTNGIRDVHGRRIRAGAFHSLLERPAHAGARAADLTRQLLAFSRRQPREPRVLDVPAIVRNAGKLIQPLLWNGITLSIDAETEGARQHGHLREVDARGAEREDQADRRHHVRGRVRDRVR